MVGGVDGGVRSFGVVIGSCAGSCSHGEGRSMSTLPPVLDSNLSSL